MELNSFILFIFIGFIAQIIDGTLGMGYGVICNSFLLGLGIPGISPLNASSSVHFAELFTTAISGFSHNKLGNIDSRIFKTLLVPGIIGGITGAYILSSLDGNMIKPFIYLYLLFMGLRIIFKALHKQNKKLNKFNNNSMGVLGLFGGFCDAIGGGGWGPIVTTTLVANDQHPRFTIGTVNTVEFFVTMAQSVTFVVTIGSVIFTNWPIMVGILIGGVVAAPFGALLCQKIPYRTLMFFVGLLIIFLSCRTLLSLIG